MDQLRLRLRLKVKVSSELSWAELWFCWVIALRIASQIKQIATRTACTASTHSDSHSHSGLMNEYAHSRRRRPGRTGPSHAEPGPTQGRLRRLLCSPRSFGDSNLNLNFDFDFCFSLFAFRFSCLNVDCRLSARHSVGEVEQEAEPATNGLITAQVQIGPQTRRRRRSYARPGQRLDISRTRTHRNFLSLRFCVWTR